MQGNSFTSALAHFTFTSSTGRKFTVRRFSPFEITQIRAEAKRLSAEQGKPYPLVISALMLARALVEPELTLADCYELHRETPGYFDEIAQAVGNFVLGNAQIALQVRARQLSNRVNNQRKGGKR